MHCFSRKSSSGRADIYLDVDCSTIDIDDLLFAWIQAILELKWGKWLEDPEKTLDQAETYESNFPERLRLTETASVKEAFVAIGVLEDAQGQLLEVTAVS
jgi:hypothetical protein